MKEALRADLKIMDTFKQLIKYRIISATNLRSFLRLIYYLLKELFFKTSLKVA